MHAHVVTVLAIAGEPEPVRHEREREVVDRELERRAGPAVVDRLSSGSDTLDRQGKVEKTPVSVSRLVRASLDLLEYKLKKADSVKVSVRLAQTRRARWP